MKTIILQVPLLIGTVHEPAGQILDASDELARRLIAATHARLFTRTDHLGSGTIEPDAPTPAPTEVETASRKVSHRKAARLVGKAV